MDGNGKISTPAAIKRAPLFPYLWSKVETVSAASPLLSGKMSDPVRLFLMLIPSSLTSLHPVFSKEATKRASTAFLIVALYFHQQVMTLSYVHLMNHLMVIKTVHHIQIRVVTLSVLMQMGRTC
jgi:hypothetical protein